MALIVKKELETGLVLEEAYCKVEEINANKEKMSFHLSIYLNKEARNNGKVPFQTKVFSCEHNLELEENSIKQAYKFLKTLDEFIGYNDDFEE